MIKRMVRVFKLHVTWSLQCDYRISNFFTKMAGQRFVFFRNSFQLTCDFNESLVFGLFGAEEKLGTLVGFEGYRGSLGRPLSFAVSK